MSYRLLLLYFLAVGGFCSYDEFVSPDDRGSYNWTETAVESPPIIREVNCFYEPSEDTMARRACVSNNTWRHPIDGARSYDGSQCITNSTYQLRLLAQVSLIRFIMMCIIMSIANHVMSLQYTFPANNYS